MEPTRQMEIQLGHMCNNRCVFCVSGQRTAMREAFPIVATPILERIREQYEQGIRKLTLLGGEPTIQPEFLNILRAAVQMGFEEIVLFTNGVKTARDSFVEEILATGGNITFRFSFQGATKEAHERTTKKDGSFDRLVQSLQNVARRGLRPTVNMCVVRSNYESVAEFPRLLLPHGVRQLHLDMIRPLDAGIRTEEELRAMLPRYSDMVPALEEMVAGFPEGFDVNIGNLPYCIAPRLAPVIHHDGEQTFTVAIDDKDAVSRPWNKYEVKRRDKLKLESCATCVFDAQCSGIFQTYRDFYGTEELVPVTRARLAEIDPQQKLFTLHLQPFLDRLQGWMPPEPFAAPSQHVNSFDHEVQLVFGGPAGSVRVALRRPGGGIGSTDRFSLHLLEAPDAGPFTLRLLRALQERLLAGGGATIVHPVGDDAGQLAERPPRLGALLDVRLAGWLRALRGKAPFADLVWSDLTLAQAGREATLHLRDREGAGVRVVLALKGVQPSAAYHLERPGQTASPALVDGLRQLFGHLRGGASREAASRP